MSTKPINPMIAETGTRRRWIAFLTTSAAIFTLCCLIWPFSVSGFRTTSSMLVSGVEGSAEELESQLSETLIAQMDDESLGKMIQQIEDSGNLRSRVIEYRDYQSIRESIRIGHVESNLGPTLRIALEGNGGADERQLVNLLSNKVFVNLNGSVSDPIASQSKVERFKQAEWIIDQMAEDIGYVKSSLGQIRSANSLLDDNSGSEFHLASSKKVVTPSVDELKASIDSIDIESLRVVIEGLKADSTTSNASSQLSGSSVGYSNLKPSKTLPINGVPSSSWLFLIGCLSMLVGSVVAFNLRPFETRGFDDTQSIREKLQVPIVATLNLGEEDSDSETDEVEKGAFANRVARIAGMFLLAVVVVLAGFILINAEVREAFWSNPFFGCAKIVRMFAGY